MTNDLQSLFSGPFYIDGQYASSFIPSLVKYFSDSDKSTKEFDKEKKINSSVQEFTPSADNGSVTGTAKTVAIVSIKQPIIKYSDSWYRILGTKDFSDILARLDADDTVAGVVFDIDSGGGQVYGTPEFYDNIRSFSKPIVTYTDGYLCSAAYYIANATDYIVANKRADHIGSIGAYASFVDGNGLIEHFGGKVHTLYASKSKDKNSDYREIMDNANYEPYIKNQLDPIVETFHADMKATRPSLKDEVFGGATYNGVDALNMNLIDENGNLQTAILKVFELSSEKSQSLNNNSNTMSKERTNLQAVLGLESPLVATKDQGSYLNEEQLDALETHLTASSTALTEAQEARTKAETALAQEKEKETAVVTELNGLAKEVGVEPGKDSAETIAAMSTKIAELNAKPGATHTTVKKKTTEDASSLPEYVDLNNSIYSQLPTKN